MLGRSATRRGLGIKNHVRDAGRGVATPCTSISTHTRIGDSHVSRNARTPTPRGRRIALSCGTAAGAALIAASISMGTAPAAGADVIDADPVSDLIGASDPHAFSAAGVPDVDAISHLIGALDPNAFSTSGAPTDALGLLGYGLDTYLLVPTGLDNLLAPYVDELGGTGPVGSSSPTEIDAISHLIGALDPNAFSTSGAPTDALGLLGYGLDTYLLVPTGLDNLLAPYVDELVGTGPVGSSSPTEIDAVSELIGALDPNAFSSSGAPTDALGLLGYGLDTYLLVPTGLDNLLAPYVEDLLSSLPSGAASVLDADPVSDLIGALDPNAFNALGLPDDVLGDLASGLDTYVTASTGLADALDPVIDGLLGSGLSLF